MYRCPRCRTGLTLEKEPTGLAFTCPRGHGDALTVPVLRKRLARTTVNTLWQTARTARQRSTVRCPSCENTTAPVPLPRAAVRSPASPPDAPTDTEGTTAATEAPTPSEATATDDVVVDACALCQVVWFDTGELEALPPAPPEPDDVRPERAPADAPLPWRRTRRELVEDDTAWTRTPWLVYALTVLVLLASVEDWLRPSPPVAPPGTHLPAADRAFRPNEWTRDGGATWVTSFFPTSLPRRRGGGGLFFAILGLYTAGIAIERLRGRLALAALLLAGNVAACLTYLLAAPSSDIPLRGATSGLTAAVTWLALARPHARLALSTDDTVPRVSARAFGISWVLGVAIVAFLFQGSPWPPHTLLPIPLVGAVVGVAAWGLGLWRDPGSAPETVG